MEKDKIEIKRIKGSDTWDIRHKVMWPDKDLDYVKLPEDSKGEHFGLFINDKLTSIISLFFKKGKEAQFRKFATLDEMQGKGYGSYLLNYIMSYLQEKGIVNVWANSRVEKADYYEKFGMHKTCKTYHKGGIDFVIMEREF